MAVLTLPLKLQFLQKDFLKLASGEVLGAPQTPKVMIIPGNISEGNVRNDASSIGPPSFSRERKIMVANMLPLHAQRDHETREWNFCLDEDSLLLHLKDGFPPETEVLYVGSLKAEIEANEQDEVASRLLEEFKCVPTFVPHDIQKKFYHGFCKQHLWPVFHYMLPVCTEHGDRFDRRLWQAYASANEIFADKIMEVVNPEEDFIWVHDYHLMVLPTFLRKNCSNIKLGFFLHSPFPASEIYKTLPVRDEILKGLLNSDLIGFHTFDYARHFLSCCGSMLGLAYESKRGYIGLDYLGRTVYIKILPVGIHLGRLESVLNLPCTCNKVKELRERYKDKSVILGVDDLDIFKGISMKLLAFEHLLELHPHFVGKLVLIQIVNPARSSGKDVEEAKRETYTTAKRINDMYGCPDYQPVVLIDRHVPRYEKTAYYVIADCCIVNAVRDGMNLVPYKYVVCRQGTSHMDETLGINTDSVRSSMIVISEFIGCSPSLSGAIRVNPWDFDSVAEGMNKAIRITDSEKQLRHEKHYRYVSSHDVAYWARSFMQDLERACKDHRIGLGPKVSKLSIHQIVFPAYARTSRRAIFLDYDGTIVSQSSIVKSPDSEVVSALDSICNDRCNTVFIVSGRGRTSLCEWLAPCEKLGLAAEHGYFIRWNRDCEWESMAYDLNWKEIVEPIMKQYTEATGGSSMEIKESALVWHHLDADPVFGSFQAKELLAHLENVLAHEPAVVQRGQHFVEVKPQGVTKGSVVEKVLSMMVNDGKTPDFVMCIGDDRSDEDMFESIQSVVSTLSLPSSPETFTCTVGHKASMAKYYLLDTTDVATLLQGLANSSNQESPHDTDEFQVAYGTLF